MTFHLSPLEPNWHAVMIHYPLALLSLGLLIEIFSPLWRRGAFRKAGRWMLLLGTLLAIPAVTTGIYAMAAVVGGNDDMTWAQHAASSPLTAAQWTLLIHHLWWNVAGAACFIVAVIVWLGGSDKFRHALHWPLLVVTIIGMLCLIGGGWDAGKMVYGQGLAVTAPAIAAPSHAKSPANAPADPDDADHAGGGNTWYAQIQKAIDPLQLHLFLAGLTFALAALSLGLSFRALCEDHAANSDARDTGDLSHDERLVDALRGDDAERAAAIAYPPSRFWVLAFLVAICTAAAGLWNMDLWTWPKMEHVWFKYHREFAHAIGGACIIILSLALALATRFARRRGWLLGILSLVLILVVAAQIWMGVLLAFDSMQGPVWRFNAAASSSAMQRMTQPILAHR